jgi:hypothetical protein
MDKGTEKGVNFFFSCPNSRLLEVIFLVMISLATCPSLHKYMTPLLFFLKKITTRLIQKIMSYYLFF